MKFTLDGQIVDNSKSTKITIPKKKIISCNDYFYNKNSSVKSYCPDYYSEDYIWNYFEIKIDLSKFPNETAYLIFSPYHSGSYSSNIIPYLYSLNYQLPSEFDISGIVSDSSNVFNILCNYFDNNSLTKPTIVLEIINSDKKFNLNIHSPLFSGDGRTTWSGSISKVENQKKNILILGIGSKANHSRLANVNNPYDPNNLTLERTQFVFLNAKDDNPENGFKIFDVITMNRSVNGNGYSLKNSHKYAWKFGIVNQTDNDVELDVASYKKDLTPMGEKLAKAVNGSLDGEAIEEIKPEYEIKQILPLTKDKNFHEEFLEYDGLKLRCRYNHVILKKNRYDPIIEDDIEDHGIFTLGSDYRPLEFWLDLGINLDNITGISFHPGIDSSLHFETQSACSVKDYEIYISKVDINYQLLIKNTYDILKGKDPNYNYLFKPEEITFDPITFRYLKIKILNIYFTKIDNYNGDLLGFAKLRVYTNTKNLYIKEVDQSISNYKDNSFNQVTTKPEWDQKSKEDKIILNKQASFDNPSISKIKNELNDFRIITNSNNIPIYEKT